MARYKLIHQHRKFTGAVNWRGWHMDLMQDFVKIFNKTESDQMEIEWVSPRTKEYRQYVRGKYFEQQCFIEDSVTNKFWVINYQDRQSPLAARYRKLLDDPDLVGGIKIMYAVEGDYTPKIKPWFYFCKDPQYIDSMCDEARKVERTQDKLFFRGYRGTGGRRQILHQIKNIDRSVLFPETMPTTKEIYFKQLSESKLALCIMGTAHACHREIECFAVGTPVLCRPYRNHYYDPLIPNVHYISAECNRAATIEEQAAEYVKNYKRVIGNTKFLEEIAENAAAWYDRNVRRPNSLIIMKYLLGIPLEID